MKLYYNFKKYIFLLLFFFLLLNYSRAAGDEDTSIFLENFENYSDTTNFLNTWLLRDNNKNNAVNEYKIVTEDNNKYLSASSNTTSIQIAKKIKWNIQSYPILKWKWKVNRLPEHGNEDARGRNDSAASIYVIFQRSNIPFLSWKYQPINVIKYIWSTELPTGKIVHKDKTKAGKTIYEGYFYVIESGNANSGIWLKEERNVLEDYRKVFKNDPKYDPYMIAILTDSNDTKSAAAADYDDILIEKAVTENTLK